ncbi:MAG TPA: T9SS type A sorting domain-containing protein [Puia sp.]|jgi:hypothetical protein|nr:T9SS type A sorting domain-containing protein [Puia sp.]
MKPQPIRILCGFLLLLISTAGLTQPAIEFASGSGPAGNGYTNANQIVNFQNNALNPVTGTYTPLVPAVSVTFAISNQQYVLLATQNPTGADVVFGANVNGAGKTPSAATLFPAMNYVSNPQTPDFSATQDNLGTGISMTDNYAVELFTSAMGLYNANAPTNGTYYMADLTVTFSTPLADPVLHIVGLGGTSGALGLTTQLTLTTAGVTMSKLSGSPEFSVTATTIVNTSATPTATTAAGAASGSVLITGNNVTTLKFKLYLRGDGKTPSWSTATEHVGDAWLMGVSALNTFVALPIGTTSFTAKPQQHAVGLQWTTEIEQNSKFFSIQRSPDGADWSAIGQVAAAGNSNQPLKYDFVDQQPLAGTNYYRLEEVDDIGASTYSPVRTVDFAASSLAVNWYPNPVRDRLTVTSGTALKSLTLVSLDGRILQTVEGFSSGQSLDLSQYPFGIYFLIIRTADGQSRTAKIERN